MVVEQTNAPLAPIVKVFYSVRNSHFLEPKDVNLTTEKNVKVSKAVIAADYNIDVNAFFERSVSIG